MVVFEKSPIELTQLTKKSWDTKWNSVRVAPKKVAEIRDKTWMKKGDFTTRGIRILRSICGASKKGMCVFGLQIHNLIHPIQ